MTLGRPLAGIAYAGFSFRLWQLEQRFAEELVEHFEHRRAKAKLPAPHSSWLCDAQSTELFWRENSTRGTKP